MVPRETFPREVRLRKSLEFDRVQRGGRRIQLRHVQVVHLGNELGSARFGLAVSRKVGSAVVRNRVKRWLRESIRRQRAGMEGVDVVLIARPSASTAGYAALYAEVGEAFSRIRSAPARSMKERA